MKIILSPAKKMNVDTDSIECKSTPSLINDTEKVFLCLKNKSYEELKKIWNCNDKIVTQNIERLNKIEINKNLTPAVLAYEGIAYQYMAPSVFSFEQFNYIQNNLRILSGFYGVLKALDGIVPYRLEMQSKLKIDGTKDLYDFWGDKLYKQVLDEDRIIINLASKEYSKCIEKYLTDKDTYITCTFGEFENDKFVQKATFAKMARGEMVRFMAENNITNPEDIKLFNRLDYSYREDLSSKTEFVFERKVNN